MHLAVCMRMGTHGIPCAMPCTHIILRCGIRCKQSVQQRHNLYGHGAHFCSHVTLCKTLYRQDVLSLAWIGMILCMFCYKRERCWSIMLCSRMLYACSMLQVFPATESKRSNYAIFLFLVLLVLGWLMPNNVLPFVCAFDFFLSSNVQLEAIVQFFICMFRVASIALALLLISCNPLPFFAVQGSVPVSRGEKPQLLQRAQCCQRCLLPFLPQLPECARDASTSRIQLEQPQKGHCAHAQDADPYRQL